jgi:hypothetical protein
MEQLERARSGRLDAGLIKELFRSEDYEYRFPASRGERVGLRCLELNPGVAQDGP